MTLRLAIEKAEPLAGKTPKDVFISIHRTDGLDQLSMSEVKDVFRSDAKNLCEALHASLPGGTFSHLLSLMLLKHASHFVVSLEEVNKK